MRSFSLTWAVVFVSLVVGLAGPGCGGGTHSFDVVGTQRDPGSATTRAWRGAPPPATARNARWKGCGSSGRRGRIRPASTNSCRPAAVRSPAQTAS